MYSHTVTNNFFIVINRQGCLRHFLVIDKQSNEIVFDLLPWHYPWVSWVQLSILTLICNYCCFFALNLLLLGGFYISFIYNNDRDDSQPYRH